LTSALEASGFEIIEMHAGPSYPFFRRVKEKILLLWQRINRRLLHKNPRPQTDATLDVYDTIHLGFSKSVLKDYLKAEMLDWVDIASGYFNRGNMVFVVARKR
jgi:hypothetical protein